MYPKPLWTSFSLYRLITMIKKLQSNQAFSLGHTAVWKQFHQRNALNDFVPMSCRYLPSNISTTDQVNWSVKWSEVEIGGPFPGRDSHCHTKAPQMLPRVPYPVRPNRRLSVNLSYPPSRLFAVSILSSCRQYSFGETSNTTLTHIPLAICQLALKKPTNPFLISSFTHCATAFTASQGTVTAGLSGASTSSTRPTLMKMLSAMGLPPRMLFWRKLLMWSNMAVIIGAAVMLSWLKVWKMTLDLLKERMVSGTSWESRMTRGEGVRSKLLCLLVEGGRAGSLTGVVREMVAKTILKMMNRVTG